MSVTMADLYKKHLARVKAKYPSEDYGPAFTSGRAYKAALKEYYETVGATVHMEGGTMYAVSVLR